MGHPSYILFQLEQKADEHEELLRRIPAIQDVQLAWLLLLYCAVPRANYWFRTVQPEFTAAFAERHDKDVWTCLCEILQINTVDPKVVSSASLPVTLGGVGLGSAVRIREASFWASWADCLEMVTERHPSIATAMIEGITQKSQGCMGSVARSGEALQKVGMEMPSWMELSEGVRPNNQGPQERDPTEAWVAEGSVAAVHEHFRETTLWPCLSPTEQAQVRSQSGPLASVPLTALPVHRISRMDSEPFRVVLLRRLRLPLPLSVRRCSCGPMAFTEQRVRQSGS